MNSPKDQSIMAAIVKFPDMSPQEVDNLIANIDDLENRHVIKVYTGRLAIEALSDTALATFKELEAWALDTTIRTRNEEIKARHNDKITRLSQKMIEKHRRGEISSQTLIMYGISGELPPRPTTEEERLKLRTKMIERIEVRLGQYFWANFADMPSLFENNPENNEIDWLTEGF